MAEFTPEIIPLGSLSEAAAASAELSAEEQSADALQPPILTGYVAP